MKIATIALVVWCNIKIWVNKIFGCRFDLLPYKVLISLTDKCNSKCEYCDIWKIDDFENEITLEDTLKLFDGMGSSLVWLALSGGEITLVKYIETMLLEAKKRCENLRIVSFTTNGLIPERVIGLAEKIKLSGFEPMVTISLDGDQELHDRVRGAKGNYKKCIALYDDLKRLGINVNYGITLNGENKDFVYDQYYQMRHSIKAVTFVHDGGIYKKSNKTNLKNTLDSMKHIFKKYSIDTLAEIIEYIHIKISIFYLAGNMKSNLIPCEVLNASIHVMPDGGIHPCMYLEEMGNIKGDEIKDVLFNETAKNMRNRIKEDKCPHCWMNCYSPYSIMLHPFKSIGYLFKSSN